MYCWYDGDDKCNERKKDICTERIEPQCNHRKTSRGSKLRTNWKQCFFCSLEILGYEIFVINYALLNTHPVSTHHFNFPPNSDCMQNFTIAASDLYASLIFVLIFDYPRVIISSEKVFYIVIVDTTRELHMVLT